MSAALARFEALRGQYFATPRRHRGWRRHHAPTAAALVQVAETAEAENVLGAKHDLELIRRLYLEAAVLLIAVQDNERRK